MFPVIVELGRAPQTTDFMDYMVEWVIMLMQADGNFQLELKLSQ